MSKTIAIPGKISILQLGVRRAARQGHPRGHKVRRRCLTAVYRIGFCPTPAPSETALLANLGYGSPLGHGRWHNQGLPQVVYCGSSRALCQLEKRVHCNGAIPQDQALMRLVLPDPAPLNDATTLELPADWRLDEAATQAIGNAWVASGAASGLWVPSFIEPTEQNLLLNSAHSAYGSTQLHIERRPVRLDPRLF